MNKMNLKIVLIKKLVNNQGFGSDAVMNKASSNNLVSLGDTVT